MPGASEFVYIVYMKATATVKKRTLRSTTVTARIAPDLEKRLDAYARAFRKTKSGAVESILEQFLDHDNWVVREVRKGIESADRGESVSHEDAVRYLKERITGRKRERRSAAA